MENKLALELKGVTKKFGKVVANHDVSLKVHHGEIWLSSAKTVRAKPHL